MKKNKNVDERTNILMKCKLVINKQKFQKKINYNEKITFLIQCEKFMKKKLIKPEKF